MVLLKKKIYTTIIAEVNNLSPFFTNHITFYTFLVNVCTKRFSGTICLVNVTNYDKV